MQYLRNTVKYELIFFNTNAPIKNPLHLNNYFGTEDAFIY